MCIMYDYWFISIYKIQENVSFTANLCEGIFIHRKCTDPLRDFYYTIWGKHRYINDISQFAIPTAARWSLIGCIDVQPEIPVHTACSSLPACCQGNVSYVVGMRVGCTQLYDKSLCNVMYMCIWQGIYQITFTVFVFWQFDYAVELVSCEYISFK